MRAELLVWAFCDFIVIHELLKLFETVWGYNLLDLTPLNLIFAIAIWTLQCIGHPGLLYHVLKVAF